jgi:hypothetical protein
MVSSKKLEESSERFEPILPSVCEFGHLEFQVNGGLAAPNPKAAIELCSGFRTNIP